MWCWWMNTFIVTYTHCTHSKVVDQFHTLLICSNHSAQHHHCLLLSSSLYTFSVYHHFLIIAIFMQMKRGDTLTRRVKKQRADKNEVELHVSWTKASGHCDTMKKLFGSHFVHITQHGWFLTIAKQQLVCWVALNILLKSMKCFVKQTGNENE